MRFQKFFHLHIGISRNKGNERSYVPREMEIKLIEGLSLIHRHRNCTGLYTSFTDEILFQPKNEIL